MKEGAQFLVQISLPKQIADELTPRVSNNIKITSVGSPEEEEAARFGIAEAITIVGLVKGSLELIKVSVELLRLLREKQATHGKTTEAVITLVGSKKDIRIRSIDDESNLEKVVADQLGS